MTKKIELMPPSIEEWIYYKTGPRPIQEGVSFNSNRIYIGELTSEEAMEYAQILRETFLKHWKEQTKKPWNL